MKLKKSFILFSIQSSTMMIVVDYLFSEVINLRPNKPNEVPIPLTCMLLVALSFHPMIISFSLLVRSIYNIYSIRF